MIRSIGIYYRKLRKKEGSFNVMVLFLRGGELLGAIVSEFAGEAVIPGAWGFDAHLDSGSHGISEAPGEAILRAGETILAIG